MTERDRNASAGGIQPIRPIIACHPIGEWWWSILGAALILHFTVTCIIKFSKGVGDDILWMSHMALALAGVGLLVRSPTVVAAVLTGILFTHTLWLIDLCAWVLGFGFPLHLTYYMEAAPLSTWISTGHHLYLLPLLLWIVIRSGRYPGSALVFVLLIFAVLTLASFWLTDPARNVNRVHGIVPDFGFPPFLWANDLRSNEPGGPRGNTAFLLALNALATIILFIPMAALLHIVTLFVHRPRQTTAKGAE
jgi:hypothetical protein